MCRYSAKWIIAAFWAGFPEIIVCLILRDVLLGLEYIHRKGYIHRSIRASHILLDQHKAVLCGFREPVTLITNGQRTQRLFDLPPNSMKSLNWLAPEVLEQNLAGYTEKSDIYSIGITTCELANGLEPFANMPTTFMLTEKMRGNQPVLFDCSTCPDEIFGELCLVLLNCYHNSHASDSISWRDAHLFLASFALYRRLDVCKHSQHIEFNWMFWVAISAYFWRTK